MVFNIAVSNNDDHLRNHGFIYQDGGWVLSPAYDINPVPDAQGLHLNISDVDNSLDYDLAMSVIDFFQLSFSEAQSIKSDVFASVSQWRKLAESLNISRSEQERMAPAFNI
ncbi:HipA domain-containing protein [Kosakonia sp. BYX6]|uniref:HipA domain-containing protein n=1 Tax=Kosakonia calanthes TaxID=3139408 RepID=A0ABZ3BB14_9ENTR